jgi:F0F1-type ATP synthase epsilon subunit
MKLSIFKPKQLVFEADVTAASLPGAAGQLTPMNGHDYLVTPLKEGVLMARISGKDGAESRREFRTGKGVAEITRDSLNVYVASAEDGGA